MITKCENFMNHWSDFTCWIIDSIEDAEFCNLKLYIELIFIQ